MRTIQSSYTSPRLNELFRAAIHTTADSIISNITVVGGLFDKNYNLHPDDENTVQRSLKVLQRAGVGIDKNSEFHFYNLLAPLKNDFLKAAWRKTPGLETDLIIVCGIWGGRSKRHTIESLPLYMQEVPYEDLSYRSRCDEREVAISHIQTSPEGWPMAAHWSGAKIVVTRGPDGIDAVNSNHFLPCDFYRVAMATSENFEQVSGSISGPLGVVVHKDAMEALKPRANPEDRLGQKILSLT